MKTKASGQLHVPAKAGKMSQVTRWKAISQNNVERESNLTLLEIKSWLSNQKHSHYTDMIYPDFQILHTIKLSLLVLLVLLIGWLMGLTHIQLLWLLTTGTILNKALKGNATLHGGTGTRV
jgi:hypothetical protein